MKCDICSATEARVHITQEAEGNRFVIHLCETCAAKMGVNDPAGFSLVDLLSAVRASKKRVHKGEK